MQFHIVLVAPARPENVGAAARAMKTMGFTSLRIVDSEAHLQPAARWVAHGAGDILDTLQVYPCLEQALADVDFTVATTARSRARFHYYCTPQQLSGQLAERQHWIRQAALVFGREDSGLTNEELALADVLTGVPMVADYPSLNLGQAVMVYCYQLAELMGVNAMPEPQADAGQLQALRQRADRLLKTLDVADDQKLRDWLHQRLGVLQQRDTVMLHTLLHDIEKKLAR
ncbi:tRNA/rRNA methyltransferase [Serratia fonticola]|jgi:tRNA/rRNA methyltransferase|uniref:tRNA (cytidine/uridine-2'-O-)-methyltransferase TrmJ n=1 Tax=Serratia fonticola TaxID=47917 RepID=A0A542BJK4_SERFO|nr:tRNA/rRNA methyltransferase [Serratia fonticola]TQI78756.1 tRNA/rRNA methyltransferase [Serratia fonticola]TQI99222.1 tRNA/rRNA methyltransferase [Serratia fonticola]TVZ68747.1 tRNA/rRNA methyltransferase [Serratia fonticola]